MRLITGLLTAAALFSTGVVTCALYIGHIVVDELEASSALTGEAVGSASTSAKYNERCISELEDNTLLLDRCERSLIHCTRAGGYK